MIWQVTFPFYEEGRGVYLRVFAVSDDIDHDIFHDLVPSGVRLLVDDAETDKPVVIEKRGWVWVEAFGVTDAPDDLPESYHAAASVLMQNMAHKARTHPWL